MTTAKTVQKIISMRFTGLLGCHTLNSPLSDVCIANFSLLLE